MNISEDILLRRIKGLGRTLKEKDLTLAAAESCTGGLLSALLTDVSGSSEWFTGAVVAYANSVKESLLGVPADILEEHGAVSEPVVRAMARGVRDLLRVDLAAAVSGIAGPTGGTKEKPVGLVCFGWAREGKTMVRNLHFSGTRKEVKLQSVDAALSGIEEMIL